MSLTIHDPAEWGMRGRDRLVPIDGRRLRGVAIHWPGHRQGTRPIVDVPRALKGYERQHVDVNGWSAIAYSEAFDQRGEVWTLRGLRHRPAANGSNAANGSHLAFLCLLVPGEQPSEAMLAALRLRLREVRALYPRATAVVTHNDVRPTPTACPGPAMTDAVRSGLLDPDRNPPVPSPAPPPPSTPAAPPFPLDGEVFGPWEGPAWQRSGYQQTRAGRRPLPASHPVRSGLRTWQARMAERGWRIDADGLYGPQTEGVTRAFQAEKRLTVDALIGPETWRAAWLAPLT